VRGEESVQDFGGNPEGKRLLGRPRRRWEDGIRMGVGEIGWGVEWVQLAEDRDRWPVNAVMNLRFLTPLSSLVATCYIFFDVGTEFLNII
jgi:hypothetical protein